MSFVTTSTTPPTSPPTPTGSFARPAPSSANPSFQQTVQDSDETAYSIDFDALLGAKGSDDDLTEEVPVDVVRSDDVDGPSDFTQNMEAWMRGELPKDKPEDTTPKQQKYEDKAAGVDAVDHAAQQPAPVSSGAGADAYLSDTEADESESENEDQHDRTSAAMEDLKGYVVAEDGEADNASRSHPRRASIDRQIDLLSSMDDVDEEEYRSPSVPPPNPQTSQNGSLKSPAPTQVSRLSFLQPTVEDHEDTPSPRSARPSPNIARQKTPTPEVFVEDFGDASQKQDEVDRSPLSRIGSRMKPLSPKTRKNQSESESDEDREELIVQINRLAQQLQDQRASFNSSIQSLEHQLQTSRADSSTARENEQRRVSDLQKQHGDRLKDVEEHWQGRMKSSTERYHQDLEEQKSAFALVKSSFESRLSATESALQSQLAQKEAELETEKNKHAQEKEQTRVGHEARVAALEENVGALQRQLAEQEKPQAPPSPSTTADTLVPSARERELEQQITQEQASSRARIAELEARLSTSQAQLETLRTESLAKDHADESHKHTCDLLATSKSQITDLESSLSLLQKQLSLARAEITALRRDSDAARESAHVLREELSESQALVSEKSLHVESLSAAFEEEKSKGVAARDVERMLENVKNELNDERKANAKKTEALDVQVKEAQEEKSKEVADMRRRAEEAVRKAAGMLGAERSEKDKLKKALQALKTEVDQLRGRVESKKEAMAKQADGAAKDEEMEDVRRTLREQSLAAKKARELLKAKDDEMRAMREDHESINRAMDVRIQEMLQAKENDWKAKYDALSKEKKALGRALMQEWGREECGQATPQKYRYKFVQKA